MKNLIYISVILLTIIGCSKKSKEKYKGYTVIVAPDSIWDYSNLDSLNYVIKCGSFELYGDSNRLDKIWDEGLPDSMKLKN